MIAWRQFTTGRLTRLRAVSKTVSDDSGSYVFRKLAPGNYYVATLLRKPGTPPPKQMEPMGQAVSGDLSLYLDPRDRTE